jgi:anti-anti-sigma factor
MAISMYEKNGYRILKFQAALWNASQLYELKQVVEKCINEEVKKLVIEMLPNSQINSEAIGVLVRCICFLQQHEEKLYLINASPDVIETLTIIGLSNFVQQLGAVNELPQ